MTGTDRTHVRTENGVPALITWPEARAEIEAGMSDRDRRRKIRSMSAVRTSADIDYYDGRKVSIRPATVEAVREIANTAQGRVTADPDPTSPEWNAALDALSAALDYLKVHDPHYVEADARAEGDEKAAPEAAVDGYGRRIVTVNGRRYIVASRISQPETSVVNGVKRVWPGGVHYWTERGGQTFGPVRRALGDSKPGTVGAAIWAAANSK